MANYSELLKSPKWQKKRLEILSRDNFKCKCCGDEETQLQVHHLEYKGKPWEVDSSKLVTLCADCHLIISTNKIDYRKIKYKGAIRYPEGNKAICLIFNEKGVYFFHVACNSIISQNIFRKNSEAIKLIKSMFKYL